ncbi:MAG TPA: hypothetical protein VF834_14730 [Streptosporangiaceae bacterium]
MRPTRQLAGAATVSLALAACLAPAQAATSPGWRITKLIGLASDVSRLDAVTATGPGDAWTVGNQNRKLIIERWGNGHWVSIPPKGFAGASLLNGVAGEQPSFGATSATNAWIFVGTSTGHEAWHWNGTSWARVSMPSWVTPVDRSGSTGVTPVVAVHGGGTWVFASGATGYAARYNHGRWSKVPVPAVPVSISAFSVNDIWAVGLNLKTSGWVLMHWNGTRWSTTAIPKPHLTTGEISFANPVVAASDTSVWVRVGIAKNGLPKGNVLLHWNGSGWTRVSMPPLGYLSQAGMAQDGHGGLWLAGIGPAPAYQPYFYHYNSGHWTRQIVPGDSGTPNNKVELLGMTWIPGTRSLWAVGQSNVGIPGVQAAILKYGP